MTSTSEIEDTKFVKQKWKGKVSKNSQQILLDIQFSGHALMNLNGKTEANETLNLVDARGNILSTLKIKVKNPEPEISFATKKPELVEKLITYPVTQKLEDVEIYVESNKNGPKNRRKTCVPARQMLDDSNQHIVRVDPTAFLKNM